MKYWLTFLFMFLNIFMFGQLPEGFVYVEDVIPDLNVELRYYTNHNFVGKPIEGYQSHKLILTKETANALKKVQEVLLLQNLCLKVYDGYRPQRAVNHFIDWARHLNDTINKKTYYPNVDKSSLFKEEYIATRSGHSKGSTLDLTIIDANTGKPLDMGTPYDFFGEESWVNFQGITKEQKNNRQLLQNVMLRHGFRNYPKEWWHFTLRQEPFPDTYFDFVIE
ncbi:MAG: M15 family metallopeptidase [Flavobacteriales bacterium]|nr:M15 family metallopeptidase [Flavobacteriia bacterium]NCP04769.1 M15 family metallopeptidase [Flavobacteriales bacterium]PIV92657.1 MAG: peptidase M15 [Flavobacteriaceae bacterium CG17_big_fil_post_rev_8_21_14_2_50_33_15]PIY11119.1 MAG: peptidase M15 [Flavobacteriaceae bacterium CG_4_10_14_3_um_filter_33_47]PJB17804.1 MAG: peptidase M15 [Flavobacteriaceae bacterium CG_4_9_14_3_um_filter_33_16]